MPATDVGEMAQILLDTVYAQLACTKLGVPCNKQFSLCEMSSPCCDTLSLWVDGISESAAVRGCDDMDDMVSIVFRLKLLRPCSTKDSCNQSVSDQLLVRELFNDAVQFRGGIHYGALALTKYVNEYACQLEYTILPVEFVCAEGEQCSIVMCGLQVRVSLCDGGKCLLPVLPDEGRCGPCGDVTIPVGYVEPTVPCDDNGSYE